MRRTLRLLESNPCPIVVTVPLHPSDPDLVSWERYFSDRYIYTMRKEQPSSGKVQLCREVTFEERIEIERRSWVIRGGSFKKPDERKL